MTHQIVDAAIEPVQDPSKRYRCRHIFIDGHRCGSPSLRGEHLCYYHHTTRGFAEEKRLRREWTDFELPPLEDRSSVLAAVTEVLQRIACDKLRAKQAGLLLYGLQIASNNLPEAEKTKTAAKSIDKSAPVLDKQPVVEQVFINPRYGDLAPVTEMPDIEIAHRQGVPSPALENVGEAPLAPSSHHSQRNSASGHSERSEEPPHSAHSAAPASGNQSITLPSLNAGAEIAHPTPVILSEASRSFIARGAVEGPAVALAPFLRLEDARHLDRRPEAAAGRPLYSPLPTAHQPPLATNPTHSAKPEINIPNPAPNTPTWYPNNCHANEKRTSRPPHSAHRYQAAQRRRSRRRHALHGLQLA